MTMKMDYNFKCSISKVTFLAYSYGAVSATRMASTKC